MEGNFMVGKDDMLEIKQDKGDDEKPELKTPVSEPAEIREANTAIIKPVEVKSAKPDISPASMRKPLVIEPKAKAKPSMPELKGEAGKKVERVKKPVETKIQRKNRLLTLLLFICLIFIAGGVSLLVLKIMGIALPSWVQPVIDFYKKIPVFPE